MAFGFGFNKQKVLSAAEKFVQQGKLQNAIAEYEKILKADPKDLTVMNTVGDLHARLGENDKAAECFKSVGDAYASQGFTVKAIAMYKKLSKLKSSMECILRLAELYTQQGLFNDARAQYLQVAEDFLKSGQLDQAVRIFEKTLEMDPENISMRTKLAEVYIRIGKKPEAWKILTAAAESLRTKGQLAAADEILQRMLKLEPGNSYALVLRGRAALDAGDAGAAITSLTKVADLDSNPDGLRTLFQAYLKNKNFAEAGTLAAKLANVHDDNSALSEYTDALLEAQLHREALQVFQEHADRFLRNDSGKLVESLRPIIGQVRNDPQALETILDLYQKAGDTAHATEIYELLAHANVQGGDLEKAREYYLKLMQLEPANPMHARNYQQVVEKEGTSGSPHVITAEEGAVLVDELEATAPFVEQQYDDNTLLALRAALTDAELFISYNMPAKALEPLLTALPKAPRDLRLNQKLAALNTRAGRFTEAAVCCRTLESIYHDAGHAEEAAKYGDLAAKYEQRGTVGAALVAEAGVRTQPNIPPATMEFEIAAPAVHHTDETSHVAEPPAPAPPTPPPAAAPPAAVAAIAPAKPAARATAAPNGVFFHSTGIAPAAEPKAPMASPAPAELPAAPPEAANAEADLAADWEQDLEVEAPKTVESAATPSDAAEAHPAPEEQPVEPQPASEPQATEPEEPAAAAAPNLEEGIEEVRFYLGQGMVDQAEEVLSRLEASAPDAPELGVLRLGLESAKQSTSQNAEPEPEISIETPEVELETSDEPVVEAARAVPASATPQPWPHQRPSTPEPEREQPVLQELVSDLEASLGDDFLESTDSPTPAKAESAMAESEPQPVPVASGSSFRSGTLDEFVSDLEASLGSEPPTEAAEPESYSVPMAQAAAASAGSTSSVPVVHQPASPLSRHAAAPVKLASPSFDSGASVDLANIFGELKEELEDEKASGDEDPETHYNLGVAFREMGLMDEAIGEFQKVCQTVEHGHPFAQLMQTYTWLAQCFLDKGIPEAAIRWYETALKMPSLDQETRTALHYELAASFESAGNNQAALNNFLEVYGSNIDYRDVGERIKALRQ
jgi:tetratricopeptide (TPR) repeat protein